MSSNKAMLLAMLIYVLKVPLGIVFYFTGNFTALFFTLLLATSFEIVLISYSNIK